MSSDSEDGSDCYEERKKRICHHVQSMSNIYAGASTLAGKYCDNYLIKADPRNSILSGFGWLQETVSTPGETYTMLRMNARLFFQLHDLLVERYEFKSTCFVSSY